MANERLSEKSELLRARELRRELEKENRRLRSEIESMKRSERVNVSGDESLEMFESADGRLSCYKRNSTSPSSRLVQKVVLEPYKIFEE